MSSYGEKRDRDDERTRGDLKAMQDGIQSSHSSGRGGSANKKKNTLMCVSFLMILIIAVVLVVIISL
ncbi:MAG: hypothetical protein KGD68_13570 [Candidatus Lokiarchaeota archaeon]|nr:hypothetical protein [Candidatus Lokiarchaeota archaeon]